MIDIEALQARIRRSNISRLAGARYRDKMDEDVLSQIRNSKDSIFLFLLYKSEDTWTAVFDDVVFYSCGGCVQKISIHDAGSKIHTFYFENEKGTDFEFANLGDNAGKIWIVSTQVSFAFQNIILLMEKYLEDRGHP